MATITSITSGNWTTQATWGLCNATAESDSNAASTALTASYAASTAFTPGAITVSGLMVAGFKMARWQAAWRYSGDTCCSFFGDRGCFSTSVVPETVGVQRAVPSRPSIFSSPPANSFTSCSCGPAPTGEFRPGFSSRKPHRPAPWQTPQTTP